MTKETKIGLLVGLGIILIIGIVVTDHLSIAAHQDPANLIDFAPEAYEATFTPRTPGQADSTDPVVTPAPTSSGITATPAPTALTSRGDSNTPPRATDSSRVIPMPQEAAPRTNNPANPNPPSSPGRPVPAHYSLEIVPAQRIVLGDARNSNAADTDTPPNNRADPANATRDTGVRAVGSRQTLSPIAIREAAAANRAAELSPPPPPTAPSANTIRSGEQAKRKPKPIYHTVRDGESLYEIAEKYYKNGNYWRTLREANPAVVGSDGQIRAGVDLLIPNKAGLVKKSPTVTISSRANATARRDTPPPASSKYYTVRDGETLSSIAARELKNEKKWYALFQANRKLLRDDPDRLQVGMKLVMP